MRIRSPRPPWSGGLGRGSAPPRTPPGCRTAAGGNVAWRSWIRPRLARAEMLSGCFGPRASGCPARTRRPAPAASRKWAHRRRSRHRSRTSRSVSGDPPSSTPQTSGQAAAQSLSDSLNSFCLRSSPRSWCSVSSVTSESGAGARRQTPRFVAKSVSAAPTRPDPSSAAARTFRAPRVARILGPEHLIVRRDGRTKLRLREAQAEGQVGAADPLANCGLDLRPALELAADEGGLAIEHLCGP